MKLYKYIPLTALAVVMAACSSDDELGSAYLSDPDAVRIEVTVGGLFTRSNPLGTEDEQKAFNSGDEISVYILDASSYTPTNRVDYTYDGTSWSPTTAGEYQKWESDNMTFYARYPAGSGDFYIPTDQSTKEKIAAADLLIDIENYKEIPEDRTLNFNMLRVTNRVVVTIDAFGDEFSEDAYISALSVKTIKAIPETGSAYTDYSSVTPYVQAGSAGSGKVGTTYYAIVAPNTYGNDDFITLTVTDGNETKDLVVKNTSGMSSQSQGKSYEYSLTVGKDEVTIGSVTVTDWGSQAVIPGGEAQEFIPLGDKALSEAAAGDFYMKDGTLVDKSAILTAEQTEGCIGIVFARADEDDTSDYSSTGIGTKSCLGYVIALDKATEDAVAWSTLSTDVGATDSYSGFANTQKIVALADFSASTYPAVWYAVNYSTEAPSTSSGWFLPSKQQLKTALSSADVLTSISAMGGKANASYWSSTEVSSSSAYSIYLGSDGTVGSTDEEKTYSRDVRPMLAF